MQFIPFTDQWPVLFDDQNNPLYGRLKFYDLETSLPKHIYTDDTLTIEASNPQYTDINGKTIIQICLGTGVYKVVFERYIGSGNMMDPINADDDSLWVQVKVEQVCGLDEPALVDGLEVINVNTIAELRLVDTTKYSAVRVLGYYDRFDLIEPRTYVWAVGDTRNDNYGTIIQHTGETNGRWRMLEPQEMDSRYFGVFPSTSSSYNSELTSLIAWCESGYSKCKVIRFSRGTYTLIGGTFSFNSSKVIMENGVKFNSTTLLTLNINTNYEILTNEPLVTNKSALSTVKIKFNYPGFVNATWFGNWMDSVNGDTESLAAMTSNVSSLSTININTNYFAKTTVEFTQNINFTTGSIWSIGGYVKFNSCVIQNQSTGTKRLRVGTDIQYNNFEFKNTRAYSSLFVNNANFEQVLSGIQENSSCEFEFDSDVTFNGEYIDNQNLKFNRTYGQITANGPSYVLFKSFNSALSGKLFNGDNVYVAIDNQPVKLSWFLSNTLNQGDQQKALQNAARCAAYGSGILDLCNINIYLNNGITIDTFNPNINSFEVRNGSIYSENNTESIILFNISANLPKVKFTNVVIAASEPTYDSHFIRVNTSATIDNLTIDSCSMVGATSNSQIISTAGAIEVLTINNCNMSSPGYLINNPTISQLVMNNNYRVSAKVVAPISKPIILGNYFESCDYVNFACYSSALINSNRFFQTDLRIQSNSGLIDAVICNNSFESTLTKYSRIILDGQQTNTLIKGLNVCGNSWIGDLSGIAGLYEPMIITEGTFSTSGYHKMNVSNNSFDVSKKILVPQSKCSVIDANLVKISGTTAPLYALYLDTTPPLLQFNSDSITVMHPGAHGSAANDLGVYRGNDPILKTDINNRKYIEMWWINSNDTAANGFIRTDEPAMMIDLYS